MLNRLFSPPDIPLTSFPPESPPTNVSAQLNNPYRDITFSTIRSHSFALAFASRNRQSNVSVSLTVKLLKNFGSCSTYEMLWYLLLDFETSAPFKSTSPAYVAPRFSDSFLNNRPLRAFKNVVFPEPLGPSTHSKRPHRAEPLAWSKIVFVVTVTRKSHHSSAFR
jgi:hypothetical protein